MHTRLILAAALASVFCGCGETTSKDPATAIAAGAGLCASYNFDRAAEHFAAARMLAPAGSEAWLQATFGLAVCRQQEVPIELPRVAEAAALFKEVVEKGGASPLAAQACLNLGRIAELRDTSADTPDLEEARRWYKQVVDTWPDAAIAGEASLRMGVTWIQSLERKDVEAGIAILEARAARPNEPWAGALWKQAGDAWWVNLGDRANAVRCLGRCIEAGHPDPSRAALTVWRAAKLADESGDRDAALGFYRRIIERHPNSGMAWDAQQRMRELGVEPPPIKLAVMPEEKKA
ncbi:MAG: tetratricopeptide repeat protein [Planctomycetes bacterium]|nr:tetratricopeptide repeat protein [Planctomycetota bacterium]